VPFRGEYYMLNDDKRSLVGSLIYPVPDPRYPFLGVHFTRRVSGEVEAGPNAVLAMAREGYSWGRFSAGDVADMLGFEGFWRMAAKHWRTGIAETHRSLNEALLALQEAARAYETADTDIQAARALWAAARREGSADFSEIDHALQRAVRYFEGMTYIHSELDRSSPDGLMRQITANRDMQRVVVSASAAVASALARSDSEAAASAFAELSRAEETVYITTATLSGVPGGAGTPVTVAERYPHQYAILNSLAEQIKDLMQHEREAPDVQQLREVIQQRIVLQRLLERLDRDDRFGLR